MSLLNEKEPNVHKVVFVGLDNAGKTSIILSLLREISKFATIKPTRNAERRFFEFLGMSISEWDLGGHERYRKYYLENFELIFRGTDILIYVIDIQDNKRIKESYNYLDQIIINLSELKLNPPIHVFFHKNDPDKTQNIKISIDNKISYLKGKIEEFHDYNKFSFYKTTVFDLSSIIYAMSEILLTLYPRSKVIDTALREFVNKSEVEGVELIDDNSLIISSYYQNDKIKEILTHVNPFFLRLMDEFGKLDSLNENKENQMIVERFERNFIFRQFNLIKDAAPFYIFLCTVEPVLDENNFNALIKILRDILSHEV
ncbi:MAG: ADP-ribosylation factor-like protein [Promethearchaeota archaeon]